MLVFKREMSAEVFFYFSVYVAYLVYGIWGVFAVRDEVVKASSAPLAEGWALLGRPRDNNNDEMEQFTEFMRRWGMWYGAHLVMTTIYRIWCPKLQVQLQVAIAALAILFVLRTYAAAILAAMLMSFYLVSEIGWKPLVWMLAFFWTWVIHYFKEDQFVIDPRLFQEYFAGILSFAWTLLRGCSFALQRIDDRKLNGPEVDVKYTLAKFTGYILYFPTLVFGPLIGYDRYLPIYERDGLPLTKAEIKGQLKDLAVDLGRVLFWWTVLRFVSHYLYIFYMARDVFFIGQMWPQFSQYAVGYLIGQVFFLNYVIMYGMGIAIARFDGMRPPQRPRCIGYIYYYSEMWKFFDEGLYEFLFRHIYMELCSKDSSVKRKLFATAVTFFFVFVWHGGYAYILVWSVLNFLCLVLEKFFKAATSSESFVLLANTHFGPNGADRVRALLATQIFIPAAFANVYFVGSPAAGSFLLDSAYGGGLYNYFFLTFCSYSFIRCADFITRRVPE